MTTAEPIDHAPWPERPVLLLALGAAFGLLFHFLTRGASAWMWTDNPWEMAAAAFVAVSGIVFAFSLERLRWAWSVIFAGAAGLVVALVGRWNGTPQDWGTGESGQFFAALIAVAIAVPLFQAARDAGRFQVEPRPVHLHVWTNLILWAAAWAFVGATFLLTLLLSELFHLIGIDLLRDLLQESWFGFMLAGGALGGAVGLLRDRDSVLHILQRVVRTILSVLAPVLAIGLVIFVVALPFTGLEPLWSQTKSTTPILMVCVLGAVVLINAVIGNGLDEESRSPVLRYAALGLSAVLLPLALVAVVSTGKRIGQYGFTPDRMWAAVFVFAATVSALLYLVSVVRGRAGWPETLRRANVRLAFGLSLLALFLALPIVSFGTISARDQVARLQSGKVAPEEFDWAALRFEFGPAGRRALERIARSGPTDQRKLAARALARQSHWEVEEDVQIAAETQRLERSLRVVPMEIALPASLRVAVAQSRICSQGPCILHWKAGEQEAFALGSSCKDCGIVVSRLEMDPSGKWTGDPDAMLRVAGDKTQPVIIRPDTLSRAKVEVREVMHRQVFLDGRPVGQPFD